MVKQEIPSSRHLRWLIESRAENQRATADLYEILTEHPGAGRKKKGQTLVAIAFSLWRAAFLADRTGRLAAKSAHAERFLLKMLMDNAITYAQDRESREWSFNYYLDNARYRLEENWPGIDIVKPEKRTARNRWDVLHNAFAEAVRLFKNEVKED